MSQSNNTPVPVKPDDNSKAGNAKPHCGIIMPISPIGDYTADHWQDVLRMIKEAAEMADFTCDLVSNSGQNDIIHSSIINNIFSSDVVICDISALNPNVMLELGLRIASKMPLIIIWDRDKQYSYPFDINQLRYHDYPRSLHHFKVREFKDHLATLMKAIHDDYKAKRYNPFLDNFKNVKISAASIPSETQDVVDFLQRIDNRIEKMDSRLSKIERPRNIHQIQLPSSAMPVAEDAFVEGYNLADAVENALSDFKIPEDGKMSFELFYDHFRLLFPRYRNVGRTDVANQVKHISKKRREMGFSAIIFE